MKRDVMSVRLWLPRIKVLGVVVGLPPKSWRVGQLVLASS